MWIQRQEKNRFGQYDGAVFFLLVSLRIIIYGRML